MSAPGENTTTAILTEILASGFRPLTPELVVTGSADLPSVYAVTDLAVATIGAAGLATAELLDDTGPKAVTVDRKLASLWFASTIRPLGWTIPPPWDPIAGDYAARDSWIRLHTNAPRHRDAANRRRSDLGSAPSGAAGAGEGRDPRA